MNNSLDNKIKNLEKPALLNNGTELSLRMREQLQLYKIDTLPQPKKEQDSKERDPTILEKFMTFLQ